MSDTNEHTETSGRRIGRLAGRPVDRVGFGAGELQFRRRASGPDHAAATAVLRRARELGLNHIDTAHFYRDGLVNSMIRTALHPYADDLVLATKVGARTAGDTLVTAQQPAELRAEVEANLADLDVERLDLVYLRRVDAAPGIIATGDQVVDLDDQLAELTALRDEGSIAAIGLSNVSVDQLRQAAPAGIAAVQDAYSLVERDAEPVLTECAARDMAFVPFYPLGSGIPGRARVTDDPRVIQVARRLGATPTQVGLAWLLARDEHVLLIPGTTSVEHLEQNAAAGDLHLDDDARATLGNAPETT